MTIKAVRDSARALTVDASWPAVPFVETINTEPDPDTIDGYALWATLLFEAFDTEPMCVGPLPKNFMESGTITFRILAQSGRGDDAAIDAAALVQAAINGWSWVAGMRPPVVSGPVPLGLDSDGNWIVFDVDVSYQYEYVQT